MGEFNRRDYGKDKDEATILSEFSECEYGSRMNGIFSEYDFDFYVV